MKPLLDAHNHLQATALAPRLEEILETMAEARIGASVVNGTSEEDWPRVADLARRHPTRVIPSFGLHPWHAARRTKDWQDTLEQLLNTHPQAGVGECGLDRWMDNHDLDDQIRVLRPQLALARKLARPLTLHCLRAWGPLLDLLRAEDLPTGGFLLHAYGGSRELVGPFAKLGAYFSFSGYFLHDRKASQRNVFLAIPRDRLLIETDAPSMGLPQAQEIHRFPDHPEINHPANLETTFRALADLLGLSPGDTRALLDKNETRFFRREVG